ncbi:MAG: L,D-transpeptidase [Bacillota bacterium]|nr:L,D-transpeptidase [Bacillota bacterium]
MTARRSTFFALLGIAVVLAGVMVYHSTSAPGAAFAEAQAAPAGGTGEYSPSLRAVLEEKGLRAPIPGLWILVDKSEHTLSLFSGDTWLKSYHVEIGDGGAGDKHVAGDHLTPEGRFYVSQRSVLDPPDYYLGSRWMRLSYPNAEDAARGLARGLIDRTTHDAIVNAVATLAVPPQGTALGGGIGIHGGDIPSFGPDWTWGCVALTNADVEEIYDYIGVGTPVVIQK